MRGEAFRDQLAGMAWSAYIVPDIPDNDRTDLNMDRRQRNCSTSRLSRRQKFAQGEASAASATLGGSHRKEPARFSGRQETYTLSPANAGSGVYLRRLPRAALRFTSFRVACSGLNSAVRNADSLNGPDKGLITLTLFITLIALLFAGCNRSSGGGISAGTGGFPGPSSQPVEISSSSQVVKVETVSIQIPEGGSAEAIVRLTILAGYHVNANPATYPYLIPTEVKYAPDPDGFCATVGKPIYPAASKSKFDFAEDPLAVYEGVIEIKIPLRLPKRSEPGCNSYPAKGTRGSLPIKTTIQACDHEKCFPPANIDATIPVEVN